MLRYSLGIATQQHRLKSYSYDSVGNLSGCGSLLMPIGNNGSDFSLGMHDVSDLGLVLFEGRVRQNEYGGVKQVTGNFYLFAKN